MSKHHQHLGGTPIKAPSGAALGITAKSVCQTNENAFVSKAQEGRAKRFELQRSAAKILPTERVGNCLWTVASNANGVSIVRKEATLNTAKGGSVKATRARFKGLQTCGSVWFCPVCSARISEVRRQELNKVLMWARGTDEDATHDILGDEGATPRAYPLMLTLTASHTRKDVLVDLMDAMKKAKQKLRNHRTWRELIAPNLIGTITATEITDGANGWHLHFHEILLVSPDAVFSDVMNEPALRRAWIASLNAVGRSGNDYSLTIQNAAAAGQYVAKWGAAEELTLGAKKEGAGLHPFQILDNAAGGCAVSTARFREYAAAFKGRRQLVWSPGLKALCGLNDKTDEEAAEESESNEDEYIYGMAPELWGYVRHARRKILDAAEMHDDPVKAVKREVWLAERATKAQR